MLKCLKRSVDFFSPLWWFLLPGGFRAVLPPWWCTLERLLSYRGQWEPSYIQSKCTQGEAVAEQADTVDASDCGVGSTTNRSLGRGWQEIQQGFTQLRPERINQLKPPQSWKWTSRPVKYFHECLPYRSDCKLLRTLKSPHFQRWPLQPCTLSDSRKSCLFGMKSSCFRSGGIPLMVSLRSPTIHVVSAICMCQDATYTVLCEPSTQRSHTIGRDTHYCRT